ncbi:YdeI family protein [uncultured Microbulbifer sp.]|uniref:YdeI/OmpD-associated family protein n=1 Tax=uncultured Microbulbifer sp. TaxID=348147 RepID=UPI0025FEB74E|nr:YdeI/OmpD-associated family protein [uncultured Microbulbifer sp.]
MKAGDPDVHEYVHNLKCWKDETEALRKILLRCGMHESLKWGKPCYTWSDSNVAILQGFKNSVALLFFKGALMEDPDNIMEKPGANSQAGRRIPFTDLHQITALEPRLEEYIRNAIKVEQSGEKVDFKQTEAYSVPEELRERFERDPALKAAFAALTPGRQRGYLLHFSQAKQRKTREARIEKYAAHIHNGKGIHDR